MTTTLEPPVVEQPEARPAAKPPTAARTKALRRGFSRLSPTSVAVIAGMLIIGVLALWFVLFGLVLSGFQENRTQKQLYTEFRSAIAAETAPLGGVSNAGTPQQAAVAEGTPVALISIPGAGLRDAVIVQGTSSRDLAKGPGLFRTSVLPGQVGVSVVYGKSVLYSAPFREIPDLRKGSKITATTQQGIFNYVVDRVRRAGDPLTPVVAGTSRLVLVTSEASGWRSGWGAQQTVYVDASLQGKPTVTLGGQPSAVPADEQAMADDTDSLVLIVLGLQALLIVAVLGIAGFTRWTSIQTYAVVLPVTIALLWWFSDQVALLLPNLL